MLKALERHYDFLAGVDTPPPVRALATALEAMKEGRAAPLLAAHLVDPANLEEDIAAAARALAVLATPSEASILESFVHTHRASYCVSTDVQAAVVSSVRALARVRGSKYLPTLKTMASDPRTCDIGRTALQGLAQEVGEAASAADDEASNGDAGTPRRAEPNQE